MVPGLTETATPAGVATVTVAVPVVVLSACAVAITVTLLSGVGAVAGGVYTPPLVMAPQAAPVQLAPDKLHVTPWFAFPTTVAVKVVVEELPAVTPVVPGVTLTLMAGAALICTVALAVLVLSA